MTMTFGSSLIVMLLGMFIVFVGLIILIAAIKILSAVMKAFNKPKAAPAPAPVPAPAPAAAPVVEEAADDGELIAVISAAIAAFDGGKKGLVVRSVRRVGNAWANAGRREQMNF